MRKELEKMCRFGITIQLQEQKEKHKCCRKIKKIVKIDNGFESWVFLQGKINFLLIFSLLFDSVFNPDASGTVSPVWLVFSVRKKV